MIVRLIVPRRADRGHRDRLWRYCRAYWAKELPDWPIVEGVDDREPWSRSAAINDGARGPWDVAVILDADVILDIDLVTRAVERAASSGRMVLPFRRRLSVSQVGTQRILGGFQGSWARWVIEQQGYNVSTCVVVPRPLWDEVGGFDERFVGWGGEDDAFWAACRTLRGVDKHDGDAWHLWHAPSPWRDHRSAIYRQAKALADRYIATTTPAAMRALLDEPRTPDQIALVCITNGKRANLAENLARADRMLTGPIGRRVIAAAYCRPEVDGWETVPIAGHGYCEAVRAAIDVAIGSGQRLLSWLEDDFTIDAPVDLGALAALLDAHPELVQVSLKRQAWYPNEVEAGGIIEADPAAFTQRDGYVEHRAYWTMNPMLTRRETLASAPWPDPPDCERRFGVSMFRDERARAAIWGRLADPPRVTHVGRERAGNARGY